MLNNIPGIKIDGIGRVIADSKTFQTNNPKYFAAGDAMNGGKEVVNAAAEGKKAARGIHGFLK